MSIKKKLETFLSYYGSSRGVGHTQLAKSISEKGGILVVVNKRSELECDQISLSNFDQGMVGKTDPIVFDNYAIMTLFTSALTEIERLGTKINNLQRNKKGETDEKA